MPVLVLGAGVSGLTTALRLAEAGHAVTVWARDRPGDTVSAVAAAIWYPYRADPPERVAGWAAASFRVFERLAADPATGVAMRDGLEVFRAPVPDPWWADAVPGFRRATPAELPPGYAAGYALRVPVVDMSVYLGWLVAQVEAAGVRIQDRAVADLAEPCAAADAVVNCTGLGAREVADDPSVYGVRGQIQTVRAPAVDRFIIDDAGPTYVVPRVSDVVLGGTAEERVEATAPDPATADAIRARCAALVPALADAAPGVSRVGVRPCRPTVRLEAGTVGGALVVHNYGHGGAGVTLSWGCADEVVGRIGPADTR